MQWKRLQTTANLKRSSVIQIFYKHTESKKPLFIGSSQVFTKKVNIEFRIRKNVRVTRCKYIAKYCIKC